MNFRIITGNRRDFLTLQNILDSTIKYNGVDRTIKGLKIDDENFDSGIVEYLGKNINVYFEFNRVNGVYKGELVIEQAPEIKTNELIERIKTKLPALKLIK